MTINVFLLFSQVVSFDAYDLAGVVDAGEAAGVAECAADGAAAIRMAVMADTAATDGAGKEDVFGP